MSGAEEKEDVIIICIESKKVSKIIYVKLNLKMGAHFLKSKKYKTKQNPISTKLGNLTNTVESA